MGSIMRGYFKRKIIQSKIAARNEEIKIAAEKQEKKERKIEIEPLKEELRKIFPKLKGNEVASVLNEFYTPYDIVSIESPFGLYDD